MADLTTIARHDGEVCRFVVTAGQANSEGVGKWYSRFGSESFGAVEGDHLIYDDVSTPSTELRIDRIMRDGATKLRLNTNPPQSGQESLSSYFNANTGLVLYIATDSHSAQVPLNSSNWNSIVMQSLVLPITGGGDLDTLADAVRVGTTIAFVIGKAGLLRPVAAAFALGALAASAALSKRAPARLPVAASFALGGLDASVTLTRREPLREPRAALAVSQATVEHGRSVELRWAASDAVSVEISSSAPPGIGAVTPAGSIRVAPEATTTWTLTATGAEGTTPAVAAVTVAVTPRAVFGAVSLLPPNATAFERALEAALARGSEAGGGNFDIPIRKLWSAADCPPALLPYLAWTLGVEEWDPDWPAAVKRAAVANAFAIHREKGTLAGLKRVLSTAGAEYEYVERPAGVAMTAKLSILNSNAVYLPDITRAVGRVKRASLQLDIELLSAAAGEIPIAGGLGAATVAEIGGLTNYA